MEVRLTKTRELHGVGIIPHEHVPVGDLIVAPLELGHPV